MTTHRAREQEAPQPAATTPAPPAREEGTPLANVSNQTMVRLLGSGPPGATEPGIAAQIRAQLGRGQPLPRHVRADMEGGLGHDFGHVVVHRDTRSASLAQRLGARAFTTGRDVFFGSGAYDPDSTEGRSTIAHELTHTVQRQSGGHRVDDDLAVSDPSDPEEREAHAAAARLTEPAAAPAGSPSQRPYPATGIGRLTVRRDPLPGAGTTPAAPAMTPAQIEQMAYQATVLRKLAPMPTGDQQALGQIIGQMPIYGQLTERDRKRAELAEVNTSMEDYRRRNEALARGEELSGGTGASPELMEQLRQRAATLTQEIDQLTAQIDPILRQLGTTEQALRQRVEEEFPRLWRARAAAILESMLAENEAVARREKQRYADNVCSPDVEGLLAADRRLAERQRRIDELGQQRDRLNNLVRSSSESLPGGVPEHADSNEPDRRRIGELDEQIRQEQEQLQQERTAQGMTHAILLRPQYRPGSISAMSRADLERMAGTWADEVLADIAHTREAVAAGTLKLWDLNNVADLTWQALGVAKDGPLGQVVARHQERERSAERDRERAIAALAITAGIIAGIATFGGAALVAAAATGVSLGVGIAQLGQDVAKYRAESAAGNVSTNPALAQLSQNEPQLLPIVLDIIGIGLDIGGAIGIARQVATAERALAGGGAVADFTRTVHAAVPNRALAERLIARGMQSAEVGRGVATASGAAFSTARTAASTKLAGMAARLHADTSLYAGLAAKLQAENRVVLMTEAAIRSRVEFELGNVAHANALVANMHAGGPGLNGFADPVTGLIFVKSQDPIGMAAWMVHEATHYVQSGAGRNLMNFMAEFQAFSAQRRFLQAVVSASGRDAVPTNLHWLLDSDAAGIARHISGEYARAYPMLAAAYSAPAGFDSVAAERDMLNLVLEEMLTPVRSVR